MPRISHSVDALVIPGGESTTVMKLLERAHLDAPIVRARARRDAALGNVHGHDRRRSRRRRSRAADARIHRHHRAPQCVRTAKRIGRSRSTDCRAWEPRRFPRSSFARRGSSVAARRSSCSPSETAAALWFVKATYWQPHFIPNLPTTRECISISSQWSKPQARHVEPSIPKGRPVPRRKFRLEMATEAASPELQGGFQGQIPPVEPLLTEVIATLALAAHAYLTEEEGAKADHRRRKSRSTLQPPLSNASKNDCSPISG